MKRNLTCIVCPMGCALTVTIENGVITDITGNTCPRGEKYAHDECTNPARTVTSTILGDNGKPIPVKTDRPIPKDKVFECMEIINRTTIKTPVKTGDVAIRDVFGSNIVVTAESE